MTAAIGVLCARVKVEEKGIIAALAEAGVPAAPFPPADSPLPITGGPVTEALAAALPAPLLIDRCQDRAVAAAMLPIWRTLGAVTLDAGLAATGNRAVVAATLEAAGLPRPVTRLCCSEGASLAALEDLGFPTTLLPLDSGAAAVSLIDRDTAEAVLEHRAVLGTSQTAIALMQAGVAKADTTSTLIVVNGQAVAYEGIAPGAAMMDLAEATADTLGAIIAGVVLVRTATGVVIWDVLPVPAFRSTTPLVAGGVIGAIVALVMERMASIPELTRVVRLASPVGSGQDRQAGSRHWEVADDLVASA